MNYPLISEYVEAIKTAEDNFDQLKNLRPVLDNTGNPVMSSGNYAVVFKMQDSETGEYYAIKCFIKDEPNREENYIKIAAELQDIDSPYMLKVEYLRNELYVCTSQSTYNEFPVLKMPWVEGKTFGSYLSSLVDILPFFPFVVVHNLTYSFCKLAKWLLSQDFAHGDLKPDNIIIKENGMPVLVDYDGMYVPSMKGSSSYELGSPGFRHPSRMSGVFNEHIDDFAIAVIALSLRVLSLDSTAFQTMRKNDFSLFSEADLSNIGKSEGIKHILGTIGDDIVKQLWGVFLIALSTSDLTAVSFRLISAPKLVDTNEFDEIHEKSQNKQSVGIKKKWTLIDFAQAKGKMHIGTFTNKSTGEQFKACVFTDRTNGDRCFVSFNTKLGPLTAEEITRQKDKLYVVELESGNYSLCCKLEDPQDEELPF